MYDKCENQRRYKGESIIFLGEGPFKDVQIIVCFTHHLLAVFHFLISHQFSSDC